MQEEHPPIFKGIPCRGCFFIPHGQGCAVVHRLGGGDHILIEREATNPHDSNAIKVSDLEGNWFGYIGKEYAAEIAPWMDQGWHFIVWKTSRVKCETILTLEPIRKAKKTIETSSESNTDVPAKTLLPVEH